jgi:membrane protein YqaA with SNARE-associated domain
VGVPPLYAVAVAAGTLRLGLPTFVALGFLGRLLRFAAILLLPRLAA